MRARVPARVPAVLFFLFFFGFAVCVLAFVDLHWGPWLLAREPGDARAGGASAAEVSANELERLRRSIVNVRARQCGVPGEALGTGFVVRAGYVATAAHVLGDQPACGSVIRLIDSRGREHVAVVEGLSSEADLALLRIEDTSLPPLELADSSAYESPNEVVKVVTIGYPLEDLGASTPDGAAISGEGSLSRFDRKDDVFVTSGLNLNEGNSGGPVFVRSSWQVLGIARAKLPAQVGEGIGYVAPIKAFENFFRQATGQELR
jgi:S1-C subfamily serine protease